jgi:hypothetical protein
VGHFLLIPYLSQLDVVALTDGLDIGSSGIPVVNDALMWINLALSGKKRAAKVNDLTDPGIAIASGLPVNPDQSHLHRFLKKADTEQADWLIKAIGKQQYKIGQLDGSAISLDSHIIQYNGKMALQKDFVSKSHLPRKAVKIHATMDQIFRHPIYLMARYPGKTAVEIGDDLTTASLEIIADKSVSFTMDKWFSVGELLEHIRLKGQIFITLIRRHEKRIQEMENIPLESFRRLTARQGVTSIKTTLRNYEDSIRLVVVEDTTDDVRTYYGYLVNDDELAEEEVIKLYSNRWGIEFWFDECQFLGINDVPSIELNVVTMHLAMNLIAYNVLSAFRANLGNKYVPMNAETINDKFFKEQALVKLRDDQITVTIFGHKYREVLEPLYHNLNTKLESKDIDPKVPWLNNHTLNFVFK